MFFDFLYLTCLYRFILGNILIGLYVYWFVRGVVLNLIPLLGFPPNISRSQSPIGSSANLYLIMTAKHPSSALTKLQSIIRLASPDQKQQLIKVINAYQDSANGGLFERHFQDLT